VPWEKRDRLGDNGFDDWGLSIDLEPDGFTLLAKGFTVIGLMEQLALPQPGQCKRIAAFLQKLSLGNTLKVLQVVASRQRGEDEFKTFTLEDLAQGAQICTDDCRIAVGQLEDYGWLASGGNEQYNLTHRLDALLLPLLALTKAFCVDLGIL
jgi:hypothetical protein